MRGVSGPQPASTRNTASISKTAPVTLRSDLLTSKEQVMSRYFAVIGIAILSLLFINGNAQAQKNRPIQIALITPAQIFPEDNPIVGLRLNLIYGRSVSVKGLDWGLINHTTTGTTTAWQAGFIGMVDSDFLGLQDNAVNVVKGSCEGLQIGIVNYTNDMHGLQLGLINYAKTTHGLQIGALNIISQNGAFPVFPVINWSF
ncbi:LA_2272 family surface repeat-containing protein [Gemmatimonadota bacterium]